ncbi:MAG TPA: hypothetical protein DIC42_06305 [Holosporales bacterium]|nr:hypothetical protein [Holosporales bacterium]
MAIRYTQAERAGYVDAFKASCLSQTDFCKTQNISFKSFNNWLRLSKRSALQASSNTQYSGLCTTNPASTTQPLISNGQAGATEKFKPEPKVSAAKMTWHLKRILILFLCNLRVVGKLIRTILRKNLHLVSKKFHPAYQ